MRRILPSPSIRDEQPKGERKKYDGPERDPVQSMRVVPGDPGRGSVAVDLLRRKDREQRHEPRGTPQDEPRTNDVDADKKRRAVHHSRTQTL